jgi:hypothetical protein
MDVRLPDGTVLRGVPDGTTKADIIAKLQANGAAVPAEWLSAHQPASVQAERGLMEIPRRVGLLAARYGIEGLAQVAEIGTEPIRYATDRIYGAVRGTKLPDLITGKPQSKPLGRFASDMLDTIGLPKPETAADRVFGDATRMVAGAGGMMGAAGKAANAVTGAARTVFQQLAAAPGAQAVGAGAAGAAGGAVREAGGGDGAQFAAALAAGLSAPLMMAGAAGTVDAAGRLVRSARMDPQKITIVLKTELAKQGIQWDDIGATVKKQLVEDARQAVNTSQPLKPEALARLVDYRRIGATPLIGDITQDPVLLTQQRNLSKTLANSTTRVGGADLPMIQNANAQRVLSTLDGAATSPLDEIATGQGIIDSVQRTDDALTAGKRALYKNATEASGRDVELGRGAFVNKAFESLAKSNKLAYLPEEIGNMLDQISVGQVTRNGKTYPVPFDVNAIDVLETMLADASRGAKSGNARAAVKQVRNALDQVDFQPSAKTVFGGNALTTPGQAAAMRAADAGPADAIAKFRTAREAARRQFQWAESSKFIEDALGGAAPDKFVQRHVIGAPTQELAKLKAQIKNEPELINATRRQLVDYIMKRGSADPKLTTFTGKGLEDGLKAVGDRKLALFFTAPEIADLKAAVNVARLSQSQPIGSAINNSNSGAMVMGKFGDMLGKTTGIPMLGPLVTTPLQTATIGLEASSMRNLSRGLVGPATARERASVIPLAALLAAPSANGRDDQRRN